MDDCGELARFHHARRSHRTGEALAKTLLRPFLAAAELSEAVRFIAVRRDDDG